MKDSPNQSPFNSTLETGIRTLTILVACFPSAHDLGRLVKYDYLVVHSADADGPPSLHPALPLRRGELLVRRGLVETGLQLLMSRSLVSHVLTDDGVLYKANEQAGAFLDNLKSPYLLNLRLRANWIAETFESYQTKELDTFVNKLFEEWTTEFQIMEQTSIEELFE